MQRLKRYHIQIPPLLERKEDIPTIVQSIIAKSSKPNSQVSPECLNLLMTYRWPRNVRELEDTVSAMIMNASGNYLTAGDLPKSFFTKFDPMAQSFQSDSECFIYKQNWNVSLLEAQKGFTKEYIAAIAKRVKAPLTLEKLSRALRAPKSTVSRKLIEFGISRGEWQKTDNEGIPQ